MKQEPQPTLVQRILMSRLFQMLQHFAEWLLVILRQPWHVAEVILVGVIFCWAVPLLANRELFDLSPVMYAPMRARGDQFWWGTRAVGLIIVWLAAVRFHNSTLRVIAQLSLIWWFFFIAGMFYIAGGVNVGSMLYFWCFIVAVWVLWRYAARDRIEHGQSSRWYE